jgi:hypothetical protein
MTASTVCQPAPVEAMIIGIHRDTWVGREKQEQRPGEIKVVVDERHRRPMATQRKRV